MNQRLRRFVLVSAVASVPMLFAGAAMGQQRIETGHSNDASNRVGSGGYNSTGSRAAASGNQIVTGNSTGLSYFHGAVNYSDPNEFRGQNAATNMDRFLGRSAGTPTVDNPTPRLSTYTNGASSYYSDTRLNTALPADQYRKLTPGSNIVVPVGAPPQRQDGDQRLGMVYDQPTIQLPQPGALVMPGPVDAQKGQTTITASPLFGIKQASSEEQLYLSPQLQNRSSDQLQLDAGTIDRLRDELRGNSTTVAPPMNPGQQQPNNQQPNGVDQNAPGSTGATNGGGAMNGAVGQANTRSGAPVAKAGTPLPAGQQLQNQPLNNATDTMALVNSPLGANTAGTDQTTRYRMNVPPPQNQSTQYAEMVKRLDQYEKDKSVSDAEAARALNDVRRVQQQQQTAAPGTPGAAPGVATPGGPGAVTPGVATTPRPGVASAPGVTGVRPATRPAPAAAKPLKKPEPVQVRSMATGITGKGLEEITKQAEDLMKQGKYTQALDKWDSAQQVAPNNPLIRLGRANTELGASYYAKADQHIREAFAQAPATTMSTYDLRNMLGEDRLQSIVKELKEIMEKNKQDARPVFLLSYIAYNTGNTQSAQAYLDLADKRAEGRDPFYKFLQDHWTLPEKGAQQDQPNK